jgi:hypothetical protein
MAGAASGYREAASLGHAYIVFGALLVIVGALAALANFLAGKSKAWFVVAPLVLGGGLFVGLFAAFWIDMEKGDVHRRQLEAEVRSGRHGFGDQPTLFAVAQAITRNDQEAIRAAAKTFRICRRPDATARPCSAGRSEKRGSARS